MQGIAGHGYYGNCIVPIIENTARECELTGELVVVAIAWLLEFMIPNFAPSCTGILTCESCEQLSSSVSSELPTYSCTALQEELRLSGMVLQGACAKPFSSTQSPMLCW